MERPTRRAAEHDTHAEARERLAELEPDDAGPEHGDRARQVVPVEDVVVYDQPVAERAQERRDRRRGAGGDHRALEGDPLPATDDERAVAVESRVTAQAIRFGNRRRLRARSRRSGRARA
jgi:hypothetical protein